MAVVIDGDVDGELAVGFGTFDRDVKKGARVAVIVVVVVEVAEVGLPEHWAVACWMSGPFALVEVRDSPWVCRCAPIVFGNRDEECYSLYR